MKNTRFPFGQPVQEVVQAERSPKPVFVLGVYASAVHARWVSANNKTIVTALAAASEPYIFWRGENAESIIREIDIPREIGQLLPADRQFNGPSGLALDKLILEPLGITRAEARLCDLVPHSCANPAQAKAIERAYLPLMEKYELPQPSVPSVPAQLTDEIRRNAILDELQQSGAGTLILLGDQPIRWFLSCFDSRWQRLSDFMRDGHDYGTIHCANIEGRQIDILPLAHPRQIAKLGHSSPIWYRHHQDWLKKRKITS